MNDSVEKIHSANESHIACEYERQPVPRSGWLGFRNFLGMYAGEHCAGTELMIGPLFITHGVGAFDLIAGLMVGNFLAVLSWMFLTAPIATRARLTMYYQAEKICGRTLVKLYNLLNGVMFCFLAGAMVTVSATAAGSWWNAWFGNGMRIFMPELTAVYPESVGWIYLVFGVGLVISVVAARGYKTLARVSAIAAPWMVLIFLAFGFIGLRNYLNMNPGTTVQTWRDLWTVCEEIWPNNAPYEGCTKFTIWHIIFFSWFCNMAMHIGMSDLSVLRFAKKSWYSVASGAGMYVGHFMAWLSASVLYACQLRQDANNTSIIPGDMAYEALGVTGLICVILAGWTTATPTIYRAGLAFQALIPRSSRVRITFITGLVATVAGMFPALAMRLMDFVSLYGLLLMPMGAIIFVDFWLMRRIRLCPYYAEVCGSSINMAAAGAWLGTMGISWYLLQRGYMEIYFISLPGWFMTVAFYLVFSAIYQKHYRKSRQSFISGQVSSDEGVLSEREAILLNPADAVETRERQDRVGVLRWFFGFQDILAWSALGVIVLVPLIYLYQWVALTQVQINIWMLGATVVWFAVSWRARV